MTPVHEIYVMVCNCQAVKFSPEGKNKQKLTSLQKDEMREHDVLFFCFLKEQTELTKCINFSQTCSLE